MNDDYDIFVCYDETTAKDYAAALYNALTSRRKYKVFVAHIARDLMEGDFRKENINPVIDKCKIFVLINSLDALGRSEIQREVKYAFPKGEIKNHDLWIFRENKEDVPYGTNDFKKETNIDLEHQNQNRFHNENELVRIALRKCSNKKQFVTESSEIQIPPIPPKIFQLNVSLGTQINVNQLLDEFGKTMKNKQYEEALQICEQLLVIDPLNVSLLNNKGIFLDILGNHDEAVMHFELGISLDKKNTALWNNKAISLYNLSRFNEALQAVEKGLELKPKGLDLIKTKGLILSDFGKYTDALELYEKGLKIKENDSGLISSKAAMLDKLGKREDAIKLWHQSLKMDQKNSNAYYNLGVVEAEKGNHEKALELYDKALKINPFDGKCLNNKGNELRLQGRYDEAIKCFDEAIKQFPNAPRPYYNKGIIFGLQEKYEEALACFNKSLDADKNFIPSLTNKGVTLFRLDKKDDAINIIKDVLKLNKNDYVALLNIGVMYDEIGEYQHAEESFKKAYDINSSDERIRYELSTTLYKREKYEEGLTLCNEILKDEPDSIPQLVDRSAIYIKLNKLEKAIDDCDHILKLNDKIGFAYYNKACAMALQNNITDALKLLETAIQLDKSFIKQAKEDEDFKELRSNEKFKKLVE